MITRAIIDRTVLIDVDGVLGNFQQHVVDQLRKPGLLMSLAEQRKTVAAKLEAGWTTWDLRDWLEHHEVRHAHDVIKQPGFARTMPVIKGAKRLVAALERAKYNVLYVSAPWLSSQTWEYDRRKWLKKNFDAKPDQYCSWANKAFVSGLTLIEDKPEMAETWGIAHCRNAMLFDQKYNRGHNCGALARVGDNGVWTDDAIQNVLLRLNEGRI